jgi:hypothetical protein
MRELCGILANLLLIQAVVRPQTLPPCAGTADAYEPTRAYLLASRAGMDLGEDARGADFWNGVTKAPAWFTGGSPDTGKV